MEDAAIVLLPLCLLSKSRLHKTQTLFWFDVKKMKIMKNYEHEGEEEPFSSHLLFVGEEKAKKKRERERERDRERVSQRWR